ncbi:MAG: tRNA dihydrouridine synthase DusB [Clostridia bacterium]|nr:tRNA dihydrouridine synthase DusB [Clostridia bacterium]
MKIRDLEIKNGIFLAPMAGVTDRAFRRVCAECGAECVTTEMISAKGVCYGDRKTDQLASLERDIRPAGIQIFGSDPDFLARAAYKLMKYSPDFFDINMGCPVRKVVACGDGSALMKTPAECEKLVRAVRRSVPVPVTVKIRAGFDSGHINAPEVAAYCESGGADAVAIHGRTRDMMYSGRADREVIAAVKRRVKIPVIANGDIACGADAASMFEQTGCDGVMIGRGALGRPYVFAEIKAAFEKTPYAPPSKERVGELLLEQLELANGDFRTEYLLTMRKHVAWYTKGMPASAAVRREVNSASSYEEFRELIQRVFFQ